MESISSFLSRFKVMHPPQAALRKALAQALFDVARVRIAPNAISLREDTAFAQMSPIARTEVRLKKREILSRVEESTGTRLRDIR